MMAYAASVGSARAKRKVGARGLHRQRHARHRAFLRPRPGARHHAARPDRLCRLDLRAAEMFHETFPGEPMTVLVDYFAREISDSLEVCRRFPDLAAKGMLSLPPRHDRRPLHRGARSGVVLRRAGALLAGIDPRLSQRRGAALSRRHRRVGGGDLPSARRARPGGLRQGEDRGLVGLRPGQMPGHGRGQGADRRRRHRARSCPSNWTETYATADIVEYDGQKRVKIGREFLHRGRPNGAAEPL